MKKLTISFLVGLFLTSNAFAVIITPSIPESPRFAEISNVNSKIWAGFGKNIMHDQAPNYLSNDYYEIKFDTPVTCLGRIC
jgi:hypothetical protein